MPRRAFIPGSLAKRLLERHGSPLYVYKKSIIRARYRALRTALPGTAIYYAAKANPNREVLKFLRELGSSVECVSPGEVGKARSAGFPKSRISYTASNISRQELASLARQDVQAHLDSLNQLRWWGEFLPRSSVSLRLNTGFGAGHHTKVRTGGPQSKFGIYYTDLPEVRRIIERYGLKVIGLHQHVGSNILDHRVLLRAAALLFKHARRFPDLRFIDIGGGLGVPYRQSERPLALGAFGKGLRALHARFSRTYERAVELRIEPGRYLVAEAGALLATVTDIKRTPTRLFIGVDTGFNHLIRPALYGAHHGIRGLTSSRGPLVRATVVGDICEAGDVFARDILLPSPREDDILSFDTAGAYGYSMSSDYNSRKKPREILI